jgi:hypothetical protein
MRSRSSAKPSCAALAGVFALAMSLNPATAFTSPAPSLERSIVSSQIEKVWWRRWGGGWGWGPAAVVGGLAAGAIVGSAVAGPRYYGPGYGPCWRQVANPSGGYYWQRNC